MVFGQSSLKVIEAVDYSKNRVPNPNTHLHTRPLKFRKKVRRDGKLICLPQYSAELEALIRKVVRDELKRAFCRHAQSCTSSSPFEPKQSVSPKLHLKLIGSPSSKIFTGNKIEAAGSDGAIPLKVLLVDANSGAQITNGPLSSMKVECVVLQGDFDTDQADWTEKEISEAILFAREGKRPLLVGNQSTFLTNGDALIEGLSVSDNSSWVRSRRFRVAIRAAKGQLPSDVRVKEAVSGPFEVRDRRGESYQKHDNPSLHDEIWRLHSIAKNGKYALRLAANGIYNVKDFLQNYYTDKSSLLNILDVSSKVLESIATHAKSSVLTNEYYRYSTKGVGLLFNCVLDLVGVTYDGQTYQRFDAIDKSQEYQAEKLKHSAFEDRSKLIPIDIPLNWDALPPPPIIPSVGSSHKLLHVNGQDSDQDQTQTVPDSDMSQSSFQYSYGSGENLSQNPHYFDKFMDCTNPGQLPSGPSLLSSNYGSLTGFTVDGNRFVQNPWMDPLSPDCTLLWEMNHDVFQPQKSTHHRVSPSWATAGNNMASTCNSDITVLYQSPNLISSVLEGSETPNAD